MIAGPIQEKGGIGFSVLKPKQGGYLGLCVCGEKGAVALCIGHQTSAATPGLDVRLSVS